MTSIELQTKKEELRRSLPAMVEEWASLMEDTDPRLLAYCRGVANCEEDIHSVWEMLAVKRFVRMLGEYEWRIPAVNHFIRFYEKLEFSGLRGRMCYRLTPIQVFQFANIFGFYRSDGRRLTRQATLFVPRKFGKTTSVASLAVYDILFGDSNAQAYMASNSEDQSNICYGEAKKILRQIDCDGKYFKITDKKAEWKKNDIGKESFIKRLTSGANKKDGYFASLVVYDEYAAARYVKGRSEGAELFNVLTSSFGARTNPLTVIMTTASRINQGPFEIMLNGQKRMLEKEFDISSHETNFDSVFISLFQPDPWDIESESFGAENVWRKCNPHIGITVLPDYYASEWELAQMDQEKRKEFLCKYLNVFQTDKVRDWISPAEVAALQTDKRIDTIDGSIVCFAGMDFSRGDDLCSVAYLCYDKKNRRFFADLDAWIVRKSAESHTNSTLYKQLEADGWLHVIDGDVIPENVVTDRVQELSQRVMFVKFGYDPYDARAFINYLEAWLRSRRCDPAKLVRGVRQTWGQFNASVQNLERLVKMRAIEFSANPLWAWCFGNAVLDEDKFGNLKPIKRTANAKIDPVICLLEGIIMMDEMQGGKL